MLLRDDAAEPRPAAVAPPSRWKRPSTALWALAAICFGIEAGELVRHTAQNFGANRTATAMFEVLEWFGREHPIQNIRFGRALLKRGDYADAREAFARSVRAQPSVGAWGGLGRALEGERDFAAAADAYEAGLALDPEDIALLRSATAARSKNGDYAQAVALISRAVALEPDNPANQQMLERARRNLERSAD